MHVILKMTFHCHRISNRMVSNSNHMSISLTVYLLLEHLPYLIIGPKFQTHPVRSFSAGLLGVRGKVPPKENLRRFVKYCLTYFCSDKNLYGARKHLYQHLLHYIHNAAHTNYTRTVYVQHVLQQIFSINNYEGLGGPRLTAEQ